MRRFQCTLGQTFALSLALNYARCASWGLCRMISQVPRRKP
jgi:hypothetical protein